MAIDRKEILDKACFGVGAVGYGPIAPAHFAYDPNFKPFEKPTRTARRSWSRRSARAPLDVRAAGVVRRRRPAAAGAADPGPARARPTSTRRSTQLEFAQILKLQQSTSSPGMTYVGWSGRLDPDGNTYDFVYTGRPNNDSQLLEQGRRQAARRAARRRPTRRSARSCSQGRADLRRRRPGPRLVRLRRVARS